MANTLYDGARERFLTGQINWSGDNIKAVLVDLGNYSPNFATDVYLSSIPVIARIATSGNLAGKTVTGGIADANDVTFTSVTGASCEALVLYMDSGSAATSPLLVYIDTATGLPITPNGGNIIVQWSNAAGKIFKL